MKHKKLLITATALFTVIVALAIFLLIWFWGDSYSDFDEFRVSTEIPGLNEGAAPQGLANYSATYSYTDKNGDNKSGTQQYYFISAYMKEGASRIYVSGEKTGYEGYVTVNNEDGEPFYGHCGGIATNGSTLWVASDSTVYVAKRSATSYTNIAKEIIEKAQENSKNLEDGAEDDELLGIQFTASFNANCGADFCFYYDSDSTDKLYVGEFYRKGNYETAETHRVTTPAGDQNTAFVYEYNVNTSSTNKYGLTLLSDSNLSDENKVPLIQCIYSVTELIQGIARTTDGSLVLSQSYGLAPSHILQYDWSKITSSSTTYKAVVGKNFNYEGIKTTTGAQKTTDLKMYFIDSSSLIRDYALPSMSEGLCANGNDVSVLFESGCYKYKAFVRQVTTDIYYFTPKKEG